MNSRLSPVPELRVLHWNVRSWIDPVTEELNTGVLEELLQAYAPELVSLVEVDETWGEPSRLADVAARHEYAWVFPPIFEYGSAGPEGGFGNAILSRLPILGVEQQQLTWPTTVYDRMEASEPRALLSVTVRPTPDRTLRFGSTHLPRGDGAGRMAALGRLSGLLRGLPEPWLMCGDFNAPPTAWLEEMAFAVAPNGGQSTYPTAHPTEPIDYALAVGLALRAEVLPMVGSDHLPVLVTATMV